MYPYIHIGSFSLGTFGLFLWLAAVCAGYVLHLSFVRAGVRDADALTIVALVTVIGVLGAKTWHELQDPALLAREMSQIFAPGWKHPGAVFGGFFEFMRTGIAWFGGLVAGIATLMWQGVLTKPNGMRGWRAAVRMLDLTAAATPIGYGIGRIGCLTSGDGDYGRVTTSHWGVHLAPDALDPVRPDPTAVVLPTPLWELGAALVIAYVIWRLGARARPLGWLTGLYLVLSGMARFAVEFWRINPKIYFNDHFSNAQVAALGSIFVGTVLMVLVWRNQRVGGTVEPSKQAATEQEQAA